MQLFFCAILSVFLVSDAPHSRAGTISGHVTLKERAPVRVAAVYANGATATHVVTPLPVVVFLEGAIAGSTPESVPAPTLSQRDTAFGPDLVIVPVGTTVAFPNRDPFFHNVFSYSKTKRFDLGRYPRGEQKTVTFDRAGTVSIFCEIHKWMRAGVVAVENGYHVVVPADGNFSLEGVPAGTYRLTAWQAERGSRTVDVTVPASGEVRVDVTL